MIFIYTFLGSYILSSIGIIVGLWAEKYDHMASATNFIIVPLSFLSGTFYSIERLPSILKEISELNPFFYIIDGFRYGFLGVADGSIKFGLLYLILLSFVIWFISYFLFNHNWYNTPCLGPSYSSNESNCPMKVPSLGVGGEHLPVESDRHPLHYPQH